jgi:hypothetical protein
MPNELNGMTIDEAIEYSWKRADCFLKEGHRYLACTWGGYCSALKDIKSGKIRLEQERANDEQAD